MSRVHMISRNLDIRDQIGPRCSAYAASCLERYHGLQSEPLELYERFFKLPDGSALPRSVGKKIGAKLCANGTIRDIEKMIDEDEPVLILGFYDKDAYFDNLHYMLVAGYDEDYFYLADSLHGCGKKKYNRKVSREEFASMWDTSKCWLVKFIYGKNLLYRLNHIAA